MKLAIFVLTSIAAVPALAQNNISWVSRAGADGNPCTQAQPCRTFQRAYNTTFDYGSVKAMDAGEFGLVVIAKPIVIDGNGVGAAIAVVSDFSVGVTVTGTGPVEIRGIDIQVWNFCGDCLGISTTNSNVIIRDVTVTSASSSLAISIVQGTATLERVAVTGTRIFIQNATATITDSVVRFSNQGIEVFGTSAATQVLIEHTKLISNTWGLNVVSSGAPATARISDCVITGNNIGVLNSGTPGQIITLRNNTWIGNTTDGTTALSASLK